MAVFFYDVKREEYVNKQMEQGCEVITTCNLPYVPYVWSGEIKAPFADRYQIFNGIERGKEMNVLTYYQFDNWIKEFDKE